MGEFVVGDLVQVKDEEYLKLHRNDTPTINSFMMRAANSICTVTRAGKDFVQLTGNSHVTGWNWSTDWIEPYYPDVDISDSSLDSLFDDGW